MKIENVITYLPLLFGLMIFLAFILPMFIDGWEIENNKNKYGESLNDYDLEKKWECQKVCGSDNVYFTPSAPFRASVCVCGVEE